MLTQGAMIQIQYQPQILCQAEIERYQTGKNKLRVSVCGPICC